MGTSSGALRMARGNIRREGRHLPLLPSMRVFVGATCYAISRPGARFMPMLPWRKENIQNLRLGHNDSELWACSVACESTAESLRTTIK